MTEQYSFTVDGSVVWTQDHIDTSALTDTITEGYVTAEEDSPTRYLSVLDTTGDISLENLSITLANPKLEVEDVVEGYTTEEVFEQVEETADDQVVVFSVEGSDELFGMQVVQDEEGNLQKYQFQFRRNDEGQLEAIPETITLIPMEEDAPEEVPLEKPPEFAPSLPEGTAMHIFVQEDNSNEHILPDTHHNHVEQGSHEHEMEDESTVLFESEQNEESLDIKPGLLQLQNVKQEIQEPQIEYSPVMDETETFNENIESPQMTEFQTLSEEIHEEPVQNFEYVSAMNAQPVQSEENSSASEVTVDQQETESNTQTSHNTDAQDFEHVEVSPDMHPVESVDNTLEETEGFNGLNDSDENDYHIVEGVHITGEEIDSDGDEEPEKQATNILRHALRANKGTQRLVKKDNKLYLYVVQHPEKENVESLSMDMSNLCKPKVNPRSILKSSHAMFQAKNEIESNTIQDERLNKRFARCKEAMQAMLFHNFINKTTIPQAPVRKNRLPRKQKIKPVERMDEEIVVQEVMVSSNGFVEAVSGGVNKENLAVTEYVELTDSDDDYDPKKVNRKKKKHRRKRIEITISDDSDTSHDSVIELDETDEETDKEGTQINNNNTTPPKRRRGRPPKNKPADSSTLESPAKKSKLELEVSTKPEIPCPKCDKTFPSQNSLKTHLQHHNLQSSIKRALPEYKYKCNTCASTFINNILLKKHMCSKLFNCAVCKKKFSDLSSLNAHRRTHAKEQMVKNTTLSRVSPKRTRPSSSTTNTFKVPKMNKCKTCGKLCSSIQNLNVHMKTHKEFICATCGKSFPSQLILEKHLRESCVKSPQAVRTLRTRNPSQVLSSNSKTKDKNEASSDKKSPKNTRLSTVRVKCEVCSLTFFSYQALFKHKVLKHGLETPDKSVVDRKQVKERLGAGVPAAKKLQNAYSTLLCELNFD